MTRFTTISASVLATILGFGLPSMAETLSVRWDSHQDQLSLTDEGPYSRVQLAGAQSTGQTPGEPELPSRIGFVVIPPGATITDIHFSAEENKVASEVELYPAQPPAATDGTLPPFVEPDASHYQTDGLFPQQIGGLVGTSRIGGYQLAALRLNPVRFNPARMELYLATSITATISFSEGAAPAGLVVSRDNTAKDTVAGMVSNPQDVDRFSPLAATADQPLAAGSEPPIITAGDNTAIYLLITNDSLASAFQPLVDRRTSRGKIGQLVTVETIESTFPGVDLPEKIRNCVKHYYQEHGTVWVALGGSETIVPPRYVEGSIPVDLYYGCLDGDWNADGDAVYGEAQVDNVDLYPEVWVGRIPVQTSAQATAYFYKLVRFENAASDGFSGSMLMGSNLTWFMSGLSRPIGFDDHDPVSEGELPMRNLYRNIIQPYWQASPLDLLFTTYSSWDTAKCGDYGVTRDHMVSRLNWGYDFAYLWGYASGSSSAGIDTDMGASLTNANRPSIMYVTASSTAAYDQQEPCISEAFLRNPSGGAVAYVGATRSAASTDYHASMFFQEVFENQQATIGQAFGVAMMNEAPYRIYKDNWRSWYLALCLQGDPALAFKGPESGRHLQIVSPHGCEVLPDNGDMVIRWNATGTGFTADERVKLQYSPDSGTTWLPVPGAEGRIFNSRFFIWEGHALPAGSHYRVRVVSLSNPSVAAASYRDFTIGPVHILTVQSTPEINLAISGTHPNYTNYTYSVLAGSPIALTAPPVNGYNFSRWADANGNPITYSSTLNLTCQGNKTVTAEYAMISNYRDYYVNDDMAEPAFAAGNDNNDGRSTSTPLRHIQQVFDRYADVAAVHISTGTFTENLRVTRNYPDLRIEGAGIGLTVIDGGQAGSCLTLSGVGACTLRNASLLNGRADNGGGIRCAGYSLTVNRCALTGNTATTAGGAISASGIMLTVDNCAVGGNTAPAGGGIDATQSPTSIVNSLFHGNLASGSGGGVSVRSNTQLSIRGCTFSQNTAAQKGGGLLISDGSVGDLNGCILWSNHGPSGAQAYLATGANLTISYCDVEGGADQVGKDAQTVLTWLEGNLTADPLFIDPSGPDHNPATWIDNNFHIPIQSPCSNAGDPQFVPAFRELDTDAEPRMQAGRVDIGCDETPRPGDVDSDGDVDGQDLRALNLCTTGPAIRYGRNAMPAECGLIEDSHGYIPADVDGDQDVDQVDFALVQTLFTGPLVRADLDRDFDVDQTDMDILQVCWTGDQVPQTDPTCTASDLDLDGDVDQDDFGLLQRCLSGDGVPPDPECLQ